MTIGDLSRTLTEIAALDPSREGRTGPDTPEVAARYARRNELVWQALNHAVAATQPAGVGWDPGDSRGVVVYIELPTVGQVSWHLPADERYWEQPKYPGQWDGHTTWEKYARIDLFTGAHGLFAVCAVEGCARCGEVTGYMESRWRAAMEAQGTQLRHVDVSTLTPEERAEHDRQQLLAVMADEHAAAADPDPDYGRDGVW